MGLFAKIAAAVLGGNQPAAESAKPETPEPRSGLSITIAYSGPSAPAVEVSDEEVAAKLTDYAFILKEELPALKAADRWFDEAAQKRRLREDSDKAWSWLLPFMPAEVAKLERLRSAHEWGPNSAPVVVKELRALVREQRKARQPYEELLRSLYGAALMSDLCEALEFESMPVHTMSTYVSMAELGGIRVDYGRTGYQAVKALGKTDVKWLVEAFGEPAEHRGVDVVWPDIWRNAIRRYCWSELNRKNETSRSLGMPEVTMQQWLHELVKRRLGYEREWRERVAAAEAKDADEAALLESAWAATKAQFVVADVETTGLKPESAELLELAALVVESDGTVVSEFSALVRVPQLPKEIVELTGITLDEVRAKGRALDEALSAFLRHIADRPVFFHNAPFDHGFLKAAEKKTGCAIRNKVHDTLPLARQAWPGLRTYRLASLSQHVNGTAPRHRALADARATLDVLLAARRAVGLA